MPAAAVTKKDRLAGWLHATGLLRAAEYLPRRECLIVLNYHRIGDPEATPFDPSVFSATAEALDDQIRFLSTRLRCVTLEEAVAFAEGRARLGGAAVLVTFDDGYLDNYRAAFPCLRSHGVQGVFFLPTSFVASDLIPWWDRVACLVKRGNRRRFAMEYPAPARFDLDAEGFDTVLLRLFRAYKSPAMLDAERFLAELADVSGATVPAERLFMNWDEAREMLRGGMAFGSHTHTHALLAKLSPERQLEEMAQSKDLIERGLGVSCSTIAYPYGLTSSFNADTLSASRAAGYRAAFSFFGGVNRPGVTDPHNIFRQAVLPGPRFRMRSLVAAVTGSVEY